MADNNTTVHDQPNLPQELNFKIAIYCDLPTILQFCVTSKQQLSLCLANELWRSKYNRDFGRPTRELAPMAAYQKHCRLLKLFHQKFLFITISAAELIERHIPEDDWEKMIQSITCWQKNSTFSPGKYLIGEAILIYEIHARMLTEEEIENPANKELEKLYAQRYDAAVQLVLERNIIGLPKSIDDIAQNWYSVISTDPNKPFI